MEGNTSVLIVISQQSTQSARIHSSDTCFSIPLRIQKSRSSTFSFLKVTGVLPWDRGLPVHEVLASKDIHPFGLGLQHLQYNDVLQSVNRSNRRRQQVVSRLISTMVYHLPKPTARRSSRKDLQRALHSPSAGASAMESPDPNQSFQDSHKTHCIAFIRPLKHKGSVARVLHSSDLYLSDDMSGSSFP